MRLLPVGCLLLAAWCAWAATESETWSLYVCMATTRSYVVGARLPPSGVFRRVGPGEWRQSGHPVPFSFSLDYDRRDPRRLYLGAGNGVIELHKDEQPWRVLTGSDITEVRDVSVGPDGAIYYGYVAGVRVSRDQGKSWKEIGGGLPRKYTEAVRVDRSRAGVLLAGTEDGVWRSEDDGASWTRSGVSGFSVTAVEQSPFEACEWLAGTERGGLFISRDCGKTFENFGRMGVGSVIYDIDYDATTRGRVVVAGWGIGVQVSEDSGKTWMQRNAGLPSNEVWSVAFDPGRAGHLFAGVHEQFIYESEDAGRTWKADGLEGSVVYRMKFVPTSASAVAGGAR